MVSGPHVLIIDDDPAIRRLLCRELRAAGYRVRDHEPGQAALRQLTERAYDLLILDVDSPAGGGLEGIGTARALGPAPILALSRRSDEDAIADALNSGADDYVRKPFGTKELLARVKNALRRKAREAGKPERLVTGDLEIDLLYRRVRSGGQEVHLAARPFGVLRALAEGAGKARSHEEILDAVWGSRRHDRQYLRLAIGQLRRKLEPDPAHPRYITTEMGVGYRLEILERPEVARPGQPKDFPRRARN